MFLRKNPATTEENAAARHASGSGSLGAAMREERERIGAFPQQFHRLAWPLALGSPQVFAREKPRTRTTEFGAGVAIRG
jgi:hypothetical protein